MAWPLIVFITALIVISTGCLLPARWCPPLPNDKLLHFTAFGGLALLAGRLVDSVSALLWCHLGLLVFGWTIEMLQNLVPGRRFCWHDLLANAVGIALATVLLLTCRPFD